MSEFGQTKSEQETKEFYKVVFDNARDILWQRGIDATEDILNVVAQGIIRGMSLEIKAQGDKKKQCNS